MAAAAVIARILTQYSDKGSKAAQKDIARLEKKISAFGKKAVKSFALAGVAATAFAVKIGTDAVKAAIEDSKSQAVLANNLRNVTGATDETIKSVEEYISKQQILANVSDTELRASFSQLVVATADVTTAMNLQSVALDTAAGSGKDLGTVSAAIAKAAAGNFTALKRLIPTLDANIVKNKDLGKAIAFLSRTYEGSAKKLGDTDPLKKLQLAYGEVLETLGYALLPVVIEFTSYIQTDVLPAIDEWVKVNEGKLAKSFEGVVSMVAAITKNLVTLTVFIEKYKAIALVVAGIPLFGAVIAQGKIVLSIMKAVTPVIAAVFSMKFLNKLKTVGSLLGIVGRTFTAGGVLAGFRSLLSLLSMVNPYVRGFTILVAGIGLVAVALKKVFGGSEDASKKAEAAAQAARNATEHAAKAAAAQAAYRKKQAAAEAVFEAERKKREAERIKAEERAAALAKKKELIEARTAALKKRIESTTGLKITDADEYELIQLTAVEKLQLKQKEADASLTERIKLRKEELALFNSLTAKTQQYLDFLKAINTDGRLDDSELAKLMSKWGLTKQEAQKYADFVYAIGDRKLNNTEIDNLKSKWGLTTQQVVDYLAKIGAPVDAKGTALSAGDIAALGWKNASSALDDYNAKLKGAVIPPPPSPSINPPTGNSLQDLIDREMAIDRPFMPSTRPLAPFERSLGGYGGPFGDFGSGTYPFGGGLDYSSIFRSSTLDNGMSLMSDAFSGSGGSQTIVVNVSGSVTSEQDLVQTIRQGLLQGQSSGYGLLLQEI